LHATIKQYSVSESEHIHEQSHEHKQIVKVVKQEAIDLKGINVGIVCCSL